MQLSRAVVIACHAMVCLARGSEQMTCLDIGRLTGISGRYFMRQMTVLARAGIVQSVKGRQGGFRLARRSEEITLLEIIETIEGPMQEGLAADSCCSHVWTDATEANRGELRKITVADLARDDS